MAIATEEKTVVPIHLIKSFANDLFQNEAEEFFISLMLNFACYFKIEIAKCSQVIPYGNGTEYEFVIVSLCKNGEKMTKFTIDRTSYIQVEGFYRDYNGPGEWKRSTLPYPAMFPMFKIGINMHLIANAIKQDG